jgi:hypothetical protein
MSVAGYLREFKNDYYIFLIMMFISSVYGLFLVLGGFYARPIMYSNHTQILNEDHEKKLVEVVQRINAEKDICFHCVGRCSSFDEISQLTDHQQRIGQKNTQFRHVRIVLSLLWIFNSIIVFFGQKK